MFDIDNPDICYYPQENCYHEDVQPPENNPDGLWRCDVDINDADLGPDTAPEYFNFLEVHKSHGWARNYPDANRLVLFRIGEYNKYRGITIGQCVMLTHDRLIEVRDRINALIAQM